MKQKNRPWYQLKVQTEGIFGLSVCMVIAIVCSPEIIYSEEIDLQGNGGWPMLFGELELFRVGLLILGLVLFFKYFPRIKKLR